MFTINSVEIENNKIVSNVSLEMKDKSILIVTVPVENPKDKEEVLAAIRYREKLENDKYDAAPVLTTLKAELDASIVGVLTS